MYTVKRLEKATQLERTEVNGKLVKAVGKKTTSRVYAVVDTAGDVVKNDNGQFEIYTRKATARQVADWYNAKKGEIMKNQEWQQNIKEAILELDNVQTRERLFEIWKKRMAILGGDETSRDLLDKFDAKFGPLYAKIMAA